MTLAVIDARVGPVAVLQMGENTAAAAASAAIATAAASAAAASAIAVAATVSAENIFATKAAANTALGSVAANAFVNVLVDESRSDRNAIYQKVGGVYVFVRYLDDDQASTLATAISSQTFGAATTSLHTSGFAETGKGAARYARLGSAPSANEQAAGLNYWLFQSNGSTVWWRLAEAQPTDLMFGVRGDAVASYSALNTTITGTDDTAALQAAVNWTVYFSTTGKKLLIPHHCLRRITNTIHVGYGKTFERWTIEGDAKTGNISITPIGGIAFTANDRPCFNTQGARRSVFRNLAIHGTNYLWLYNNFNAITDLSNKANFRGPQVRGTGIDTSKSPCAGIAVDGYSNTAPAVPYPTVTYPAWSDIATQYSKNYSSSVEFDGVQIMGFEVGIIIQPNVVPVASNGDFMRWLGCDLSFNETALSISHADARVVTVRDTLSHFVHTFVDSVTYGSATGNLAAHFDCCSFDNCYRAINANLGITTQNFSPSLVFTNAYCEATYSLGTVRTSTATGQGGHVIFEGGELNFFGVKSGMFSPHTYLEGLGEVRLSMRGVTITGTYGIFPVNCDVEVMEFSIPTVAYLAAINAETGGSRFSGLTCQFFAPKCDSAAIYAYQYTGYHNDNIDGVRHKSDWDFTCDGKALSGSGGGRGSPIPWFAKTIDYLGHRLPIAQPAKQVLNRATYNLSALSNSGKETTFTGSLDFMTDNNNPTYCIGVGDLVQDSADNRIGYIKTKSFSGSGAGQTMTITVSWVTGVYTTNGTVWTCNAALSTNTGTLTFHCGRRVLPGLTKRLLMSTTSGSGAITFSQPGPETLPTNEMGASFIWPVNVDDFLMGGVDAVMPEGSVFPAMAKITAVTSGGGIPTGAITVNQNARRTGVFLAPIIVKG